MGLRTAASLYGQRTGCRLMIEGLPRHLSRNQAAMLARLYLHPAQPFALIELAVDVGMPTRTANLEMQPLVDAGLVIRRLEASVDLYQASSTHGVAKTLTEFLAATFGPVPVVSQEFAELPETELVLIFGYWAGDLARHVAPGRDVAVLVVGSPAAAAVALAAERAEQRLDLPVNPVVRTIEQWTAGADPLVSQVQQSRYVSIRGPR